MKKKVLGAEEALKGGVRQGDHRRWAGGSAGLGGVRGKWDDYSKAEEAIMRHLCR